MQTEPLFIPIILFVEFVLLMALASLVHYRINKETGHADE